MTAPTTDDTLVEQAPRRTRSQVLFEDFNTTAETVRDKPGKWFLVGGGERDRYGVFSQTAYRIRRGLIAAFAQPQGGYWEVQVSTDQRVEDRKHPVEVYLRFVPVKG
jgi:hypothetical protein